MKKSLLIALALLFLGVPAFAESKRMGCCEKMAKAMACCCCDKNLK